MSTLGLKNKEKIKSILDFLDEFPKKKILSSYLSNTLSLCDKYLQDLKLIMAPDILNEISKCLLLMEKYLKRLKSEGFFVQYGFYEQNQDSSEKVLKTLNRIIQSMKPLIKEDLSPWQFTSEMFLKIDETINAINRYIQSKNDKKMKKMADKMKHELTYMFWMRNLAFEEFIDIKMFQEEFKSLLVIFDLEFESFNKRLILDEIDKNRGQLIIPNTLDEFFELSWTMPNDVYKLRKGEKNFESELLTYKNPEEAEQTLKVRKKLKQQDNYSSNSMKSIKNSEISPIEDESDLTKKCRKGEKIVFPTPVKSEIIMLGGAILLKVIETYNQDEYFVLNRIFILSHSGFSFTEDPNSEKQYQTHGLAKFGRASNITEYQSDIKFDRSFTEISRRQFQINMSDFQSFFLQCVSPNETYLKIHDVPLSLMLSKNKILYFGTDEIFLIRDVTEKYIIFSGISSVPSSQTKKCSYTFSIDSGQREWRLGVDDPLAVEKIEKFGCKLIFSNEKGWTIVGKSFQDSLLKKNAVKLTVNTIDNIGKGIPSDLVKLEEGMIVNIECYSLLVFRII